MAWEDAWRDALWMLAVQKRCVELEARKRHAADGVAALPVPGEPQGATPAKEDAQMTSVRPPAISAAAGEESSQDPGRPQAWIGVATPLSGGTTGALAAASKMGIMEESLSRLRASIQTVQPARSEGAATAAQNRTSVAEALSTGEEGDATAAAQSGADAGGRAAGPLPSSLRQDGRSRSVFTGLAQPDGDMRVLHDLRRLEELQSRLEQEMQLRKQAEEHRSQAEVRWQHMELEVEEAKAQCRKAEQRVESLAKLHGEEEEQWRLRHAALQRQLRRTEVALGEKHVAGLARELELDSPRSEQDDFSVTARRSPGRNEAGGSLELGPAMSSGAQSTVPSSAAVLALLRDMRRMQATVDFS
eukprot:TRINITY_DN32003_c0_g1_i1.p1 TRINITY_DN32003_c0_g1~~TRINITY_DN32003_c0_g1_i1.p1  ORF type:complete len:360 (+),score=94.69 TRINITY_DN32003_c0_g1_i1:347-1426(+)